MLWLLIIQIIAMTKLYFVE